MFSRVPFWLTRSRKNRWKGGEESGSSLVDPMGNTEGRVLFRNRKSDWKRIHVNGRVGGSRKDPYPLSSYYPIVVFSRYKVTITLLTNGGVFYGMELLIPLEVFRDISRIDTLKEYGVDRSSTKSRFRKSPGEFGVNMLVDVECTHMYWSRSWVLETSQL